MCQVKGVMTLLLGAAYIYGLVPTRAGKTSVRADTVPAGGSVSWGCFEDSLFTYPVVIRDCLITAILSGRVLCWNLGKWEELKGCAS